MKLVTTRRTAVASIGAGIAGLAAGALLPPGSAMAAMSSGAGVVAGGSLNGAADVSIQFSAFGSRLRFDDGTEPIVHGAFSWFDPTGADGGPLTLALVAVGNYGPGDVDNARVIAGTVSVNGEGEHPFAVWLVDNGAIGEAVDSVHLVVGSGVAEQTGTPAPADAEFTFDYEVEGELTAGDVQLLKLL